MRPIYIPEPTSLPIPEGIMIPECDPEGNPPDCESLCYAINWDW